MVVVPRASFMQASSVKSHGYTESNIERVNEGSG